MAAAIRRRLAPRIAVAERLIVQPPKYLPFTVSATVNPAPGTDRRLVEQAIREELHGRFSPPKDRPKWPLGRDVDASAVAGWVRSVDGVASVPDLKLIVDGREQDHLAIGKGELPKFEEPADVNVRERPR